MTPPAFHDDPGFLQRVEDLTVEKLVAQPGVEALDVAVLPWAAGRDVGSLRPDSCDPVLDCLGDDSEPLPERMCSGTPRRMNRSDRTSMTSVGLSLRSMRIASASCVNSSITLSMRYFLPSSVRDQTWLCRPPGRRHTLTTLDSMHRAQIFPQAAPSIKAAMPLIEHERPVRIAKAPRRPSVGIPNGSLAGAVMRDRGKPAAFSRRTRRRPHWHRAVSPDREPHVLHRRLPRLRRRAR